MPERTRYAPGTPSWVDLATTDVAGARSFYAALFGWEYEEAPAGEDGVYVMARRRGKAVAGLMEQTPEMAEMGMPPVWSAYVTVADVDVAAGRVGAAGGDLLQAPFDVMDAGRMAVVADPTGAVLCLWEPRASIGAELVNEHGALTWTELYSPDFAAAAAFYEQLLGWKAETVDMGTTRYTTFLLDGEGVAGGMPPPVEGLPPFWAVYFAVDDVDAAVASARSGGGAVTAEPFDVPPGRCAGLTDPAGAGFLVIQLTEPAT